MAGFTLPVESVSGVPGRNTGESWCVAGQ